MGDPADNHTEDGVKRGPLTLDRPRRPYNSPVRRQRAAETRERIITAGADLMHGFPVWKWSGLTVPAVARRAGVTERTVYRHFSGERDLRDAVLERLREEAGVSLDGLELGDLREVATRIFEYVSSFPIEARVSADPSVAAENERQRSALLRAVRPAAKGWSPADRKIAAGMLDVLWSPASYERLVADWDLPPKEAIRAITWVMQLLEDAIQSSPGPKTPSAT
jgi:AcrR family transcriptional regulator